MRITLYNPDKNPEEAKQVFFLSSLCAVMASGSKN